MSKVLICRPYQDAQDLISRLEFCDIEAIALPSIEIKQKSFKLDMKQISDIVFTSKYAIQSFFAQYDASGLLSKNIWAVGKSTAKILSKNNIIAKYPIEHGSENLLKLFEKEDVLSKKIAIISGVGGNSLLLNKLSQQTKCFKFDSYERVYVDENILLKNYKQIFHDTSPQLIIVTSIDIFNSLKRIFTYIDKPLESTITITSAKMLECVNSSGFNKVLYLDRLDNQSLCEITQRFLRGK